MLKKNLNGLKLFQVAAVTLLFSSTIISGSPILAQATDSDTENQIENSNVEQLIETESVDRLVRNYEMTANNYNISLDDTITGTVSPETIKVKLEVDGVIVRSFTVQNNQYGIYAKDKVTSTLQQVYIVACDINDNEQNRIKVNLTDSAPVLIGLEDKSIEKGSLFDPMAGVTASDDSGSIDLTDSIVVAGSVDTTKAGKYSLTYSVSYGDKVATQTITITVVETEGLKAPRVNDYYGDSVYVTGTVDDLAQRVGIYVNGEIKRSVIVKEDRSFELYVADLNLTAPGQIVEVAAIGDGGVAGPKTTVTVIKPEEVTITAGEYNITTGSFVTGEISSADLKVRLEIDGNIVRNNVPGSNSYAIYARDFVTSLSQEVYVVAFNSLNQEKARAKVNLKENGPILNGVSDQVVEIDSSFDPMAGVTATNYSGEIDLTSQITITGMVDTATIGEYTLTYKIVSDGLTTSKTATVKVVETVLAPVLDPYYVEAAFATGKVEGSAKEVGIYVNGELKRVAVVLADKTFRIYTGDLGLTSAGQTFEISAFGKTGTEGPKTTGTVVTNNFVITASEFVLFKDGYVRGTVSQDITKISLEVNGTIVRSTRIIEENYILYANDVLNSVDQNVYVIAHDSSGAERNRVKVSLVQALALHSFPLELM